MINSLDRQLSIHNTCDRITSNKCKSFGKYATHKKHKLLPARKTKRMIKSAVNSTKNYATLREEPLRDSPYRVNLYDHSLQSLFIRIACFIFAWPVYIPFVVLKDLFGPMLQNSQKINITTDGFVSMTVTFKMKPSNIPPL